MSACTDTLDSRLSPDETGVTAFNTWKAQTSATITELNGTITNNALPDARKVEYETLHRDIAQTLACLQEKQNTEIDVANSVYTAQDRIVQLQREIKEREEEIQIAKDRVTYIRDPDAHPSYYQSWFPMDRPMRPSSVPVLIGIVVFFTMLILLGLLSFLGFNLSVGAPGAAPSFATIALEWLRAQLTPPFWIILIVLIGILIWYRR